MIKRGVYAYNYGASTGTSNGAVVIEVNVMESHSDDRLSLN